MHLAPLTDAPGKQLSARLGDRVRAVTVIGTVASEPKFTPNEFTTFLLRLETIDLGGRQESCAATIQARWKGNPQLGDKIRLRGLLETIPLSRNPGEFDQEKDSWFCWTGSDWKAQGVPAITHPHFTGTGTRSINANGKQAIEALFTKSFE